MSERVRVQFANAIDTARALREIYFILIPIETNVNMFCTFELIGFRGIHTFKRRYISSRLRPVSRANPLALMKELNSLFFFILGCWRKTLVSPWLVCFKLTDIILITSSSLFVHIMNNRESETGFAQGSHRRREGKAIRCQGPARRQEEAHFW